MSSDAKNEICLERGRDNILEQGFNILGMALIVYID